MKEEISYQNHLKTIGEQVAEKRRESGMLQNTLAHSVGLSQSEISQIENGRYQSLKLTTLDSLIKQLGLNWAELSP